MPIEPAPAACVCTHACMSVAGWSHGTCKRSVRCWSRRSLPELASMSLGIPSGTVPVVMTCDCLLSFASNPSPKPFLASSHPRPSNAGCICSLPQDANQEPLQASRHCWQQPVTNTAINKLLDSRCDPLAEMPPDVSTPSVSGGLCITHTATPSVNPNSSPARLQDVPTSALHPQQHILTRCCGTTSLAPCLSPPKARQNTTRLGRPTSHSSTQPFPASQPLKDSSLHRSSRSPSGARSRALGCARSRSHRDLRPCSCRLLSRPALQPDGSEGASRSRADQQVNGTCVVAIGFVIRQVVGLPNSAYAIPLHQPSAFAVPRQPLCYCME